MSLLRTKLPADIEKAVANISHLDGSKFDARDELIYTNIT